MSKKSLLALALICGLVHSAAAEVVSGRPIQNGIGIEVGAIMNTGMSEYGDDHANLAPSAQGLFIRDRNGMTSRMVIGLLIAVAGAMAESGPKSIESKTYRSGDYIITETTTTYRSEAEKAEIRQQTNESIDSLFEARFADFEIDLYSRDLFGRGETSGYKANFMVGEGSTWGFESGFGFGKASSIVNDASGVPTTVRWKYFGMPFRLTRVLGPLRASLTYEWNWLKYGLSDDERKVHDTMDSMGTVTGREVVSGSHPWHFDVSTALFNRIALTGGVTAQTLKPELGYYVQGGIFF